MLLMATCRVSITLISLSDIGATGVSTVHFGVFDLPCQSIDHLTGSRGSSGQRSPNTRIGFKASLGRRLHPLWLVAVAVTLTHGRKLAKRIIDVFHEPSLLRPPAKRKWPAPLHVAVDVS